MKVSTGSLVLDELLMGGYDNDIITTIYGPSGSGKTNICLVSAIKILDDGKKVIFVDTEGGISVERIKQLSENYQTILDKIIFLSPFNFEEQINIFKSLKEMVNDDVGMIVVDSISMLYRLELSRSPEVYEVNSALGNQIAALVEIARRKSIPVLITNQVYSDFDNKDEVKMVGGDLLKYGSKCLLELKKFNNHSKIIIKKHRSLPEGKSERFKIENDGLKTININSPLDN
jgi:DNA repair protein RadB